ncbi:MAG: cob(I)yrinic acid a,c-diamide adenosyltransferase [Thermomicrobiales bacterium]
MIDCEAQPGLSDEEMLRAREEKRAALAADRKAKQTPKRGIVIVNTGDGKGKTTAALGVLLRAWGRGMHVVMFQFIKASGGKWGEIQAAQRIGVEIVPLGDGFTWESDNIDKDRALAAAGWAQCAEKLRDPTCDVVILDELTYPLIYGWLPVETVLDALKTRPPKQHVIITGRDAPDALIAYADLVTEMREIKHPYRLQGMTAQRGIDF